MTYILAIVLFCGTIILTAQPRQLIRWSAEASSYYALNTANNGGYEFHDLMNTAARTGLGLNILRGTLVLDYEHIHGALSLQYGDVTQAVWGKQFPIQEAWVGYRITPNIDIQAGAFLSHFGIEGLRPFENYSGIVSTTGYFDPNYFGGVKCYASLSDVTVVHVDVLTSFNGLELDGEVPAISLNIEHTPDTATFMAFSSILSEEPVQDRKAYQLYTQLSGTFRRDAWHLLGELNLGAELPSAATAGQVMTSALLGCYYDVSHALQLGLRAECVIDPHGIMADDRYAKPLPLDNLSAAGITATASVALTPWCIIRADARRLTSIDTRSVIDANPSVRARTEAVLSVDLQLSNAFTPLL